MGLNVTYDVKPSPEDCQIRGSFDSGDKEFDEALIREIECRLLAGDEWAWFCADVTATVTLDGRTYVGHSYLWACSYEDKEDFCKPDGYWPDLKKDALNDLLRVLAERKVDGELAGRALDALRHQTSLPRATSV